MKVKLSLRMNLVGCTREETVDVPDEEVEGLTEEARDKYLNDWLTDFVWNNIETGWEIVDE